MGAKEIPSNWSKKFQNIISFRNAKYLGVSRTVILIEDNVQSLGITQHDRQFWKNRRLGYRELRPLCRISDASDGKLDSNWNEFMTKMYCAVDSHNYTCNSQNRGKSKMAFGLYSLLESTILFVNALAVLNRDRFLRKIGLVPERKSGNDKLLGLANFIHSIQTIPKFFLPVYSKLLVY
ncbi:Immediate early response 3-interacting protein [Trichinella pseudospiralis]